MVLSPGHPGYWGLPAPLSRGLFGGEIAAYSAAKAVKSLLVVTFDPSDDIVTIPNCPAALAAGK